MFHKAYEKRHYRDQLAFRRNRSAYAHTDAYEAILPFEGGLDEHTKIPWIDRSREDPFLRRGV